MALYLSLAYIQAIIERGEFMDYHSIITLEPGKRGGKPCIRGLRITVYDVLSWLASGMTTDEILTDFPELISTTSAPVDSHKVRFSAAVMATRLEQ